MKHNRGIIAIGLLTLFIQACGLGQPEGTVVPPGQPCEGGRPVPFTIQDGFLVVQSGIPISISESHFNYESGNGVSFHLRDDNEEWVRPDDYYDFNTKQMRPGVWMPGMEWTDPGFGLKLRFHNKTLVDINRYPEQEKSKNEFCMTLGPDGQPGKLYERKVGGVERGG